MQKSLDANRETESIIRIVRPRWRGVILICGKCLKHHEDGKTLRRALKAEVKVRAKASASRRKTRIVKTACFGLCPRGAVVVASAATLAAGEVLLVKGIAEVAGAVPRLVADRAPS